ncbi:MAG TPA: hypothetical protein VF242_07880 [Nitrososphaeraceae archaeon]
MKSKMYLAIAITIFSTLTFALIATTTTETTFSIFENVVAQEGAINPAEDSVNDTQVDKDRGTTRSSTDFSAINDTMSD